MRRTSEIGNQSLSITRLPEGVSPLLSMRAELATGSFSAIGNSRMFEKIAKLVDIRAEGWRPGDLKLARTTKVDLHDRLDRAGSTGHDDDAVRKEDGLRDAVRD